MAENLNDHQAILDAFKRLVDSRDRLSNAAIDRRSELAEHELVIKTLEPLAGDRKCFRLVGDVMVERTVESVLPEIKGNRDNLKNLVDQYEKELEKRQEEMLEFQEKYKIQIKDAPDAPAARTGPGNGAQGVLVGGD